MGAMATTLRGSCGAQPLANPCRGTAKLGPKGKAGLLGHLEVLRASPADRSATLSDRRRLSYRTVILETEVTEGTPR